MNSLIENITVQEFLEELKTKLAGFENYEVVSTGLVQGKIGELVNPYVIYIRNPKSKGFNDIPIYIPSLR